LITCVDLPGSEGVGPVALRLLTDDAQHFRLRGSELDVIADAQEHGFGCAALFDDERAALAVHAVKQLPEISPRAQRGNYDAAGLVGRRGAHKLSTSLL
jgi:hypothetical protein